jgi:hypothetical protein
MLALFFGSTPESVGRKFRKSIDTKGKDGYNGVHQIETPRCG